MKTIIIFNPNSTGDSKANATSLAAQLRKEGVETVLKKTTHAGHGEELAAKYAKQNEPLVLISSSGDGGYHEVVNGALAQGQSKLVVGVLPSGNANDHYVAIGTDSIVEAIRDQKFHKIDTIKVTATIKGKPWVRYAHSYVGIGVTATAAKSLTEDRPNVITEKLIVARSLASFSHVKIKENGKTHRYSSIIFGNVQTMSKVIKLSNENSLTDGKFEMTSIRLRSKLRLIAYLLTAATVGLKHSESLSKYECIAVSKLPVQLDGEVYTIDAGSSVSVESMKQNLHCVV